MAEVSSTPEKYVNKTNMGYIINGIKDYVDYGSDPDGTMVINKDASGDISSIVLTYDGGVRTTTFAKTSSAQIITKYDVKTGATNALIETITITSSGASVVNSIEPITSS